MWMRLPLTSGWSAKVSRIKAAARQARFRSSVGRKGLLQEREILSSSSSPQSERSILTVSDRETCCMIMSTGCMPVSGSGLPTSMERLIFA